jgi:hypothetical protein
MESLEIEIRKYKSLLDQKNRVLKELKSKYEKAEKERLALRDDFKKVSIYIQNTQKLLDEQDEITKSANTQIAETQKENIELKTQLKIKENELSELREKQLEEINGNFFLIKIHITLNIIIFNCL